MSDLSSCHIWGGNHDYLLEMLEDAIQRWLDIMGFSDEVKKL